MLPTIQTVKPPPPADDFQEIIDKFKLDIDRDIIDLNFDNAGGSSDK
jgi:hypothetical protein